MTAPRGGAGFRGLTHLSPAGDARMVDVSAKSETVREAVAKVTIKLKPSTLLAARAGQLAKGDVFGVARTAAILAAKRTPDLVPLCHPLRITGVDVAFADDPRRSAITVEARVRTVDKTGVEMEALTAAAVAALTVYDMVKAIDRGVVITDLCLIEKSGGKSGHWQRTAGAPALLDSARGRIGRSGGPLRAMPGRPRRGAVRATPARGRRNSSR